MTRTQLKHLITEAVGTAIEQQGLAPHPSKERYFSRKEAAEFIKKSPNTLRQIVHKGWLNPLKEATTCSFVSLIW